MKDSKEKPYNFFYLKKYRSNLFHIIKVEKYAIKSFVINIKSLFILENIYIYIYFLTEPLKYKSYAINPYTSLNNRTALVQRADKANSISPDTPFFHVQGNHSRPRRRKYRRMKIQRQWGLNDPHKTRDRWFARCSSSRLIVISEGRAMH